MKRTRLILASAFAFVAASCATTTFSQDGLSWPFSYAKDRCTGAQNQCQTKCASLNDGPARAACIQQCQMQESQCRLVGDDSPSALSVERSMGEARSQREKEEDFERWKAEKARKAKEQRDGETGAPSGDGPDN
ncbi:MAG TPA: hypothetical protein VNH64_11260 [Parvularculaceae bacterium]|nr:hypothetical protein [Parvularculaceae bacterium]